MHLFDKPLQFFNLHIIHRIHTNEQILRRNGKGYHITDFLLHYIPYFWQKYKCGLMCPATRKSNCTESGLLYLQFIINDFNHVPKCNFFYLFYIHALRNLLAQKKFEMAASDNSIEA